MNYEDVQLNISDPFEVERLAPIGFNFLMASALGPHRRFQEDRIRRYNNNMSTLNRESQGDYANAAVHSIPLSTGEVEFNDSLSAALFSRSSVRNFIKKETTFDRLSFLLRMSAGIKSPEPDQNRRQSRMYPSGGALYSIRTYVDVRRVSGIDSGIYLFNPFSNSLDLVNDPPCDVERSALHNGSQSPEILANSNFEFLLTTQPHLPLLKYGEHGWKVVLMEMGHLAQNILLVGRGCGYSMYPCTSLNMATSENILRTSSKGELLLQSIVVGHS